MADCCSDAPQNDARIWSVQCHLAIHQLAVAKRGEINNSARRHLGNYRGKIPRTPKSSAIDHGEYVAGFNSRLSGGTMRLGLAKDCPVGLRHPEAVGECLGHRTNPDADPRAKHRPVAQVLGWGTGWPRLSWLDAAAYQDSRTDRDPHELYFSPVCESYQEGTVRAITHIIVRLASLPGAEDPG